MDRIKVESSNIESVGHDESKELLEVEFKNGKVYQYHPVEKTTYLTMVASESIGSYFNKVIKNDKSVKFKEMS